MMDGMVLMPATEVRHIRKTLKGICEEKGLTTAEHVVVLRALRALSSAKPARKHRVWVPEDVLRDARNAILSHFWRMRN